MERRDFILKSCALCFGGGMMASLIESCQLVPIYKTTSEKNRIHIPSTEFKENNFLIVRPSDVNYDIAIIKNESGEYHSFIMQCTHADNPVSFNGKKFSCSMHGSIFNSNGEVENGPAERNLVSLVTLVERNEIVVKLA